MGTMATTATPWNLQVPTELDADLREIPTWDKGSATEADVAAFIQEAVRTQIFHAYL
jgi:hypothetical protein